MPPKNSDKIILVEGLADKGIFEQICNTLDLSETEIQVAPPKEFNGRCNSKEAVLAILPSILKQRGGDKNLKLAVVIDADYIKDGKGYLRALERFEQKLEKYHYSLKMMIMKLDYFLKVMKVLLI